LDEGSFSRGILPANAHQHSVITCLDVCLHKNRELDEVQCQISLIHEIPANFGFAQQPRRASRA
jgi:hypothetical protein